MEARAIISAQACAPSKTIPSRYRVAALLDCHKVPANRFRA